MSRLQRLGQLLAGLFEITERPRDPGHRLDEPRLKVTVGVFRCYVCRESFLTFRELREHRCFTHVAH